MKSIKGFAAEAATAITRVVQYSEEKLGRCEKTELDGHFDDLVLRADKTKNWTERIVNKTESLLQPNPGTRVEDYIYEKLEKKKERASNFELLGSDMIDAGVEFGSGTVYGNALIKVGQTQQKLGKSEKEFVSSAYKGFAQPLKKFLDEDMKNVMKERKILEAKRLDLDAAKKRLRKAKTLEVQNNAELDIKKSQEEFDQQVEITKLLLEGISSSQANHIRCLNEFVEAQINFYAKCHQHMCDLQKQLANSGNSNHSNNCRGSLHMMVSSVLDENLFSLSSRKKRARVIFDYNAHDESELSLKANEVILVSQPSDPKADWLLGEQGKKQGKVPIAYLEILS